MATEAVKDWKELQGIDQTEFTKRFESGEFDKFMNDQGFVEAQKTLKLFEKPQTTDAPPAPEPASTPAPAPAKDEPWWKTQGYESEKEYQEAVSNTRELLEKKQSQIDRFNAERGKAGEETKDQIKRLEDELAKTRKKLEARPASPGQVAVEAPEIPILPVPEDGDYSSADYQAKFRTYQEQMKEYNRKRKEFDSSVSGLHKKISDTEQKLSELTGKASVLETESNTSKQERLQETIQKSWGNTMSEVAKLQDFDTGLKTSKPFEEINQVVRTRGYEEAAKIYPKKDIENFDRICDIIKEYHHVDNNGIIDHTRSPKHRSLKAALYNILDEQGKLDEHLHRIKAEGERKGREQVVDALHKQGEAAKPLPSGGAEKTILEETTDTDVIKQLTEYAKPEYDAKINADPALRKQVFDLMVKAADKDPKWGVMIPQKWKEEFTQKKGAN
jgi:hypothetical protein